MRGQQAELADDLTYPMAGGDQLSDECASALAARMPPWASGSPVPESGKAFISGVTAGRAAPGVARYRARNVLADWQVPAEAADTAGLLISELVTNAVKFGSPPDSEEAFAIDLALWWHDRHLVIEVSDHSMGLPFLKRAGPYSETGRGLWLVDALSSEWGYYIPRRGQKTVYFMMPLGDKRHGA
jgi:anti-sigma regulatory factor (Ser/Thr protein kinase)